jgi:hypothetical protein
MYEAYYREVLQAAQPQSAATALSASAVKATTISDR